MDPVQHPDREWKKGGAELLILSLLEQQARHGYDICKLIEARSGELFISTSPPCIPFCIDSRSAVWSTGAGSRSQISGADAITTSQPKGAES